MDIEVDENINDNKKNKDNKDNKRGPKMCYGGKRKVVYGTPHSYQVDILLDEYKLEGTRN
jgi:hypothetical protein